jgi:hypothetical protein
MPNSTSPYGKSPQLLLVPVQALKKKYSSGLPPDAPITMLAE